MATGADRSPVYQQIYEWCSATPRPEAKAGSKLQLRFMRPVVVAKKQASQSPAVASFPPCNWPELATRSSQCKIPKILHQTWTALPLPKKMRESVVRLRLENPDFQYCFYSDEDCRSFIASHFEPEVLFAFDHLRPGAFRADLFRYCVLYVHGGVYLDIKFECVSNFKLRYLCAGESVYVLDRDVARGTAGVYQGLLASLPLNPVLRRAIRDVVLCVCTERYFFEDVKTVPWARILAYTGPILLGQYFLEYDKRSWDFTFDEDIFYKKSVVFRVYPEYRAEQAQYYRANERLHYKDACLQGRVYCTPALGAPQRAFRRTEARRFDCTPCVASTPSILFLNQQYTVVQRWVNYSPLANVSYSTLYTLDSNLDLVDGSERVLEDVVVAVHPFQGTEDVRLFSFQGTVYFTGTRYSEKDKLMRVAFGVFNFQSLGASIVEVPFDKHVWQKNWVFIPYANQLALVYRWYPLTVVVVQDSRVRVLHVERRIPAALQNARGSSSASTWQGNLWFVVHRTSYTHCEERDRFYEHAFVVLDGSDAKFRSRSQFFTFENGDVEFCTSLFVQASGLTLAYSVADSRSCVAIYNWSDICALRWFDLEDKLTSCPR